MAMKKILAVSFLIFIVSETAHAQSFSRERHSYTSEAADQVVIKELQREILENVQAGRQNRRLTGKEARTVLKRYRQIASREIRLYRKKRLNERKLAEIRTDLEGLVQQLYSTVRFDKGERGGWVRAKRY
ncbi:MAG: hypothetical protein ABS46_09110 [Cytophagaceae bacterium SCN 52-12]|nr:MAG: hypothetical protein ABS46_09110 [Cytophagaceae bacterium SCN 52-12]